MPNGHLPPAPQIDPKDPYAAHFTWMQAGLTVMHGLVQDVKGAVSEVKGELSTFAVWKSEVEQRRAASQAASEARKEMAQERQRWWNGLKVRAEVGVAFLGGSVVAAGIVSALFHWVM